MCQAARSNTSPTASDQSERKVWPLLHFGVDDAGGPNNVEELPWAVDAFHDLGVDLYICHARMHKPVADYKQAVRGVDAWCRENNFHFIWNLEHANWLKTFVDDQGRDWHNRPDGRHYELIPDDVLAEFGECESLLGVMYDEPAHMQNCSNMIANENQPLAPWIYDPGDDTLEEAAENFTAAVAEVAALYGRHGIPLFTEHVLPVLLHGFARAGWTATPKILKESWTPMVIAIAMGAAIQYDTELWLTPDLWGPGGYPGHSVDEYRSALLVAYHMGADVIYSENLAFDHNNAGKGSLIHVTGDSYRVTEYGEVTGWFRKEYVPAHPRTYTFRHLKPRVAIIRQPDACWGQRGSWLGDGLFGNDAWPSTPVTEAWFGIWSLLTQGVVPTDGLNWNHGGSYVNRPTRIMCPLDGVVVYDHHAEEQHLEGVEVIFLTGIGVSDATQNAVAKRVAEGATCVALPHLLPERVRAKTGMSGILKEKKGVWVATEDFLSSHVREHVAHVLPPRDTIRYQFGDTTVTFRTIDDDPNRVAVDVSEGEGR